MYKKPRTAAASLLLLTAAVCLFASPTQSSGAPRPKIRILATVFPLMEFAREIAGDRGDVGLLLPPGAEIHTWQPRVSDIRKIAALDLFLFIGSGLEPWAADILKSVGRPGLRTIEAAGVQGPGSDPAAPAAPPEFGADPHVWLDFGRDLDLLDRMVRVLGEIDPEGASDFAKRAEAYKDKLRRLDAEYREAFRTCDERTFVFGGHAAFGYLARRYGLVQVPVYGLSPDAAPSPKALIGIIARAKTLHIRTVFFEENVSDKMARLIARELGADVRVLNPGHNLTRAQFEAGLTFIDLMRQNLENFKHGLGCR
jgi:zinc transport system substrate-binding protein